MRAEPTETGTEVTLDAAFGGRLRLLQPRRGHRFGHDAILLAAATEARAGERVADLGAGVGAAGLALAARVEGVSVVLVEAEPHLARLAGENARANGFAERVKTVALDVAASPGTFAAAGLAPGSADRVMMNPPFNDPARQQASPDAQRRRAHVAPPAMLAVWAATAARLLRPDGSLTLIWRADGLSDVLAALSKDFGAVAILPVHGKPDARPIRVLVRARKGARGGPATGPALILNDAAGRPTAEAEAVLREAHVLAFNTS